ncbi:MAG: GAF domain-containing protein [Bacteroidota bacterium]
MRTFSSRINVILIVLFVASVTFASFKVFMVKQDLMYEGQVIDLEEVDQAQPIFNLLYLSVSGSFVLGIIAMLSLLSQRSKGSENVVYIEKEVSRTRDNNSDSNDDESYDQDLDLSAVTDLLKSTKDSQKGLSEVLKVICKQLEAGQGAVYLTKTDGNHKSLSVAATYALSMSESQTISYELGEGLVGQAALEGNTLNIEDVPENYMKIISGLGSSSPTALVMVPIKSGGEILGVAEISAFKNFTHKDISLIEKGFELAADKLIKTKMEKEPPKKKASTKKNTDD